jgi:hypothetical protein
MKFDLFTKSVLLIIAVLLGLNLIANTELFATRKVKASNNFFQVGKMYSFSKDYEQLGSGKLLSVSESGWVKLLTPATPPYNRDFIVLVNTNLATTASESEEKK